MAWLSRVTKLFILIFIVATLTAYWLLHSSLPILDGQISLNAPAPATITRDKNGLVTIYAKDRKAVAFALGFTHSQERFFQMDLLRRNSAGELSELFGEVALDFDSRVRLHQFRKRANELTRSLPPEHLAILEAYTDGVNDGLKSLSTRPFEYLLLRQHPKLWQASDSLLVLFSMYMDLQYEFGSREQLLGILKSNLMPDVYRFLTPKGSRWDAAIDGSSFKSTPIPTSKFEAVPLLNALPFASRQDDTFELFNNKHESLPGSNSWVVSGQFTESGAAILANDMHLGIRMPNIWFRAGFKYLSAQGKQVQVNGVTLPGTPAMVVGSNRNLAWGFTNSYGDWSDVIVLTTNEDGSQYLTPGGYVDFETETEVVRIKDGQSKFVEIHKTIWGPVIGKDPQGQALVLKWVAHDSAGVNFNLLDLENATNINDGINIAHSLGIPAQNVVFADVNGDIAWTIAGAIPNRKSKLAKPDWQTPQDWSNGEYYWDNYLPSAQIPVIKSPKQGKIWTANSRIVGGDMLRKIGNGGYALGARAQQIRDLLMAVEKADEESMLAIATNHEARFLSRWQKLLLDEILTETFVAEHNLADARQHIIEWQGKASKSSVGYTIVQQFRNQLRKELFENLLADLKKLQSGDIDLHIIRHQLEVPMWALVTQKPSHIKPSGFESWTVFLQTRFFKTFKDLEIRYGNIDNANWGNVNKTNIQHPLSKAIPILSGLLDMPSQEVTGDSYMPNVQGPSFGASERFVVEPGQEQDAVLHMPSGQSGHPLSPYYGSGHQDWVEGSPTPLLPGKTIYKLEISPRSE